jgi:hypothetical protein
MMAERFIMAEQENNIDILENQFPACSGAAFVAAREFVLKSGQSVLESDNGVIYEVHPDGSRRRVKDIEPPTKVESGRKITIR